MTLSVNKTGLAVGVVLGAWHLIWAGLVAAGVAQMVVDFVLWMHFYKPFLTVEPFDPARAGVLVGVTAVIGYAMGMVFAIAWNGLHRKAA